MIDSGDTEKFEEGRLELSWIIGLESLKNVPILVYANKQDLEGAVDPEDIESAFDLNRVKEGREYCIQPSVATQCIGVVEGTKWLLEHLLKKN